MDLSPPFYFLLFLPFFFREPFGPIKEARLLHCKGGKFLGWEDFFPRVNKEIHC